MCEGVCVIVLACSLLSDFRVLTSGGKLVYPTLLIVFHPIFIVSLFICYNLSPMV